MSPVFFRRLSAILTTTAMLQPMMMSATYASNAASVTTQPASSDPLVTQYYVNPTQAPQLSDAQMAQLMRAKIKYVFVIFNENHSFDNEYGTFPGVNGIYSTGQEPRSAADTPGFTQTYRDSAGVTHTVQPFLLGPSQNANVVDSVDHSHTGLAAKLATVNGTPTMTGFSQDEYTGKAGTAITAASDAKGKQFANIVMSHVDCNTLPIYWQYANRFTIFDNIFATEDGPSTPNAIAMIAGQSGETQWVKHGTAGMAETVFTPVDGNGVVGAAGTTNGPPIVNDNQPFYGSEFDHTATNREPAGSQESYAVTNIASVLTFASIPLTAAGASIKTILAGDLNPSVNEPDIQKDIPAIAAHGTPTVGWRWYENGYDHEPTDATSVATHNNFVSHHEGPQYFGYVSNNTKEQPNLGGENDFFSAIANNTLPAGGIIYIRGGYANIQGLTVPIQNAAYPRTLTPTDIASIKAAKAGDDDHPSYSDRQISQAMNARVINAIASNPKLWAQSAIILTYDESDGFYDHVPPRILSYGPDGLPLARGIRVPLLVISPYARAHVVSHAEGDHNAVIQTINQIFNLPALSSLPDEASALAAGNSAAFNQYGPAGFQQKYLGPRDTNSAITDSLISAFDSKRLRGLAPILPASYAMIPAATTTTLPLYNGQGCSKIGITPTDKMQGISAPPPANFNPLASTLPQYNIPAPQ